MPLPCCRISCADTVEKCCACRLCQVDNHIAELTVRETLDFAARVQGAGFGAHALSRAFLGLRPAHPPALHLPGLDLDVCICSMTDTGN